MKNLLFTFLFCCPFLVFAQYKIENNELLLETPVLFKTGSAELQPESDSALLYVKGFLDAKTYISLMRVECHTADNTEAAQKLSEQRALAICKWLVKHGVDCKRLLAVGFGGTKPVADNSTPQGKSMNTRCNFMMAALKDRPIGGMPVDGGGKTAGDSCAD